MEGEASVLVFARVARRLGDEARRQGLQSPAFRSPPRLPGAVRSVRRRDGGAIVAIALRGRPVAAVVDDMVEGVVVVNGLEGEAAEQARTELHAVADSVAAA